MQEVTGSGTRKIYFQVLCEVQPFLGAWNSDWHELWYVMAMDIFRPMFSIQASCLSGFKYDLRYSVDRKNVIR